MKAFISYSWDSDAHKDWVRGFADQLISNGIDTTLDQYDLDIGDDRFVFMETAARQADAVLFICTPGYISRANERNGGVGTETILLANYFFSAHREKKFIPIIRATGEITPYTPDYLASLIFVDFRDDGIFNRRIEELLRHLYSSPKNRKPELGQPPAFGTTPDSRPGRSTTDDDGDRQVAERLATFLEDRRVLFSSIWGQAGLQSEGTVKSIDEIRQRLRKDLEQLPRNSELSDALWNMQEACRSFLDGYELLGGGLVISSETTVLVRDFRVAFRNELSLISQRFGIRMRKLVPDLETLAKQGYGVEQATMLMFTERQENIDD